MEKITTKEITAKIKAEYPQGIDLIYIDYNDSYCDNNEAMETLAQTGYPKKEDEDMDCWQFDCQDETIKHSSNEVFTEEELDQIHENEELNETMRETFYDIDTSNPTKQLLENTSKRYFYYDLDHHVEQCYDKADVEEKAKCIAKLLRIKYKKYENQLYEMVANASYGGSLAIMFTADPSDLLGKKSKYIKFTSEYQLVIMDRSNGSGWWSEDFEPTLILDFVRDNLHDDEGSGGYSFSGDVCGMCKGDEANFEFIEKVSKNAKVIPIETNEESKEFAEREKRYNKTYKDGGCTAGDMNYGRHRNQVYGNDYPCGNTCKECGTFWID